MAQRQAVLAVLAMLASLRVAPGGCARCGAPRRSVAPFCARRSGTAVPVEWVGGLNGAVIPMLRIYPVVLDVVREVATVLEQIERHDQDLARQMRRAMTSVALNTAEGMGAAKGNRRLRYQTALGSAQEVLAGIEVAQAYRYIGTVDAGLLDKMNHVIATLVKLSRPKP